MWSIHPKYLDNQNLGVLWRDSLTFQSVLLKGEFTKCIICNGEGIKYLVPKTKKPSPSTSCYRCKGKGKIKTKYYNHPQLDRFKTKDGVIIKSGTRYLSTYLGYILNYANNKRKCNYNNSSISLIPFDINQMEKLTITKGQLKYEYDYLQSKLLKSNIKKCRENNELLIYNSGLQIEPHPIFTVIDGGIEPWEKTNGKD